MKMDHRRTLLLVSMFMVSFCKGTSLKTQPEMDNVTPSIILPEGIHYTGSQNEHEDHKITIVTPTAIIPNFPINQKPTTNLPQPDSASKDIQKDSNITVSHSVSVISVRYSSSSTKDGDPDSQPSHDLNNAEATSEHVPDVFQEEALSEPKGSASSNTLEPNIDHSTFAIHGNSEPNIDHSTFAIHGKSESNSKDSSSPINDDLESKEITTNEISESITTLPSTTTTVTTAITMATATSASTTTATTTQPTEMSTEVPGDPITNRNFISLTSTENDVLNLVFDSSKPDQTSLEENYRKPKEILVTSLTLESTADPREKSFATSKNEIPKPTTEPPDAEPITELDREYSEESIEDLYRDYNVSQVYHEEQISQDYDHDEVGVFETRIEVKEVVHLHEDQIPAVDVMNKIQDYNKMWVLDSTTIVGIVLGIVAFLALGTIGVLIFVYHEKYSNKPHTLEDCYASSDSGQCFGEDAIISRRHTQVECLEIDLATGNKDNFQDEMYNLDNDSFLNSLEVLNAAPMSVKVNMGSFDGDCKATVTSESDV